MKDKKSNKYSPIINYYSNIINPLNSESLFNHKENNTTQFQNTISNKTNNNINIFSAGQVQDEPKSDSSQSGIISTSINNSEETKQLSKLNSYKKKIKTIRPDDLIPTTINGRTLLRINPLVYKNESYEFLSSNLYILLKDQLICKYLQETLETDTIKAVCYFYPSLLPNLLYLITDSFANYFIQKICYFLNEDKIEKILNILAPDFFDICCDYHGTRSIQGIMNYLQTEK